MKKFDTIIIGGGSAGYRTAEILADNNQNVLLVEKENTIGGVCLNHGCIPTKSYIAVCETLENINNANKNGIEINGDININFQKILNKKNRNVKVLTMGLKKTLLNKGIEIKTDYATCIDRHNVKIGEDTYYGENIVIATGSIDKGIKNIEFDNNFILNSKNILQMDKIPERMLIIGAGVIGIEMAIVFKTLGADVTIVEYFDRLLPGVKNKLIQDRIEKIIKQHKIKYYTSVSLKDIDRENRIAFLNNDMEIACDNILLATGRKPIIDQSFIDIGIEVDQNKFIIVDKRNKTNINNIFAIGDIIGEPMLAHKAYYDAKIIANEILDKGYDKDYSKIPFSIFTIPSISHCGFYEEELMEKKIEYKKIDGIFAQNGRAAIYDARDGICRILIDRDKKILGATIIGKDSDILIHELLPFIQNNLSIDIIKNTIHIHPTLSEIIGDMEL